LPYICCALNEQSGFIPFKRTSYEIRQDVFGRAAGFRGRQFRHVVSVDFHSDRHCRVDGIDGYREAQLDSEDRLCGVDR
jgi:hypothetical protein